MSEPVLGSGADGGAPTGSDVVAPAAPTPRPVPGPHAVPGPPVSGAASPAVTVPPARPEGPTGPGEDGVPLTGDAAVDEALRTLQGVEELDLRSQVAVFEDVHRALQDRLADAEG